MDIWQKMYERAQALYQPQEVSDFVYAKHVVAAVEAEDGQIFTGFCMEGTCGVFHLCAERAALFNMYQESGQTKVKRIIAFRDQPPHGGPSGMPCGACREFLMELHPDNRNLEFMVDYETRQTITLGELLRLLVNCSGLMKSYNLERTKLVLSFLMFKAMRILVLKLSKFRKPKAFRLMTLMRLLVASSFAFE